MNIRLAIMAVSLVAVLSAAYGYYWHYVAGRLQTGIEEWAAQQRGMGHEIAFNSGSISGFPFAFRTTFHAVSLIWRQPSGTLSVQGDMLLAEMRPWNLQNIFVESSQPVTLALVDGAGQKQRADLQGGDASIVLHADGRLQSAALSMRGVAVESSAGNYAAESVLATIDLPATLPVDYHQPLLGFDATLTGLRLPPERRAVTAEPIEKAAAAGSVMGPIPAAASLRDVIAGWAGSGGTVELKSFNFIQAPLTLAGEGTITLDEALQPLGALTIHAQGLPETIDLLERDGLIDARAAKTGGMMAKGLAKPDEAGHQVVSVSLSLQQGYLWLGPVKLAPLPALAW